VNDNAFSKIAFGIAAVVLLPAVVAGGGFIIAIVGAILVLIALFGGRFGLEIVKNREFGAKAGGAKDVVTRQPDDGDDWGRR